MEGHGPHEQERDRNDLDPALHHNLEFLPVAVDGHQQSDKRVLTTGLMYFNNDASSFVNLQMAGACVVILPMVVFYLIFRKQIINGVARGGIKG